MRRGSGGKNKKIMRTIVCMMLLVLVMIAGGASEALAQGGGAGNTRSGGSYVASVTIVLGSSSATINCPTFTDAMTEAKSAYDRAVQGGHPNVIPKITLLADIADTGDGNAIGGQNTTMKVTIDLNGHELRRASTSTGAALTVYSGSELTLIDSGADSGHAG